MFKNSHICDDPWPVLFVPHDFLLVRVGFDSFGNPWSCHFNRIVYDKDKNMYHIWIRKQPVRKSCDPSRGHSPPSPHRAPPSWNFLQSAGSLPDLAFFRSGFEIQKATADWNYFQSAGSLPDLAIFRSGFDNVWSYWWSLCQLPLWNWFLKRKWSRLI